jgi:hypothetical protein
LLTTQIALSGAYAVTIIGNEFEPGAGQAIQISNTTSLGSGGTNPSNNVSILNNFFYSASAVSFLKFLDTSLPSVTVSNNYFNNDNASGTPFNAGAMAAVIRYTGWGNLQVGAGSDEVGNVANERVVLPYSASMTPFPLRGQTQVITATNATAFTINAPTNSVKGIRLSFTLRNTSGGALGAATWNAVFKMSAWTNPGNGQNRSITFEYDGTNWVQVSQTGVDVPN